MSRDDVPNPTSGPRSAVTWFLRTENPWAVFARETLSSAAAVGMVGLLLFAVSGLWPPLVAVESGSMNPHLQKGDLVFVMEEDRFPPAAEFDDTGVVTYQDARRVGYTTFGSYGDVIVYQPNGQRGETPIIHRARFYVSKGENWYDQADKDYLRSDWDNCRETPNCPAPNAGFITKGDNNPYYDQVWDISRPVKESWIRGTAEFRIPWLGWIRLLVSGAAGVGTTPVAPLGAAVHPGASPLGATAS